MENVFEVLQPILADIANACSIIALFMTVGIFFGMKRITGHFLFKARVPRLLRDIGKHAKELNTCLYNVQVFEDNRKQAHLVLSQSEITVTHILPRLRKDIRARTKRIQKSIRLTKRRIATATDFEVFEIYSSLRALETDLKNEIENATWSRDHD